jgi:hypothetical protein
MKPVMHRLLGCCAALLVCWISTLSNAQQQPRALKPDRPQQDVAQPAPADVALLCERTKDIKLLPHKDEPVDDPAFNALLAAGDAVIPCLIRKISDETVMDDPRQAPKVGKLSVGDVAFFLVVRLGKADFVELLPAEVKKAYDREGVYGYFRLIDENNNRHKLQDAVIKWYEKKYGRSFLGE